LKTRHPLEIISHNILGMPPKKPDSKKTKPKPKTNQVAPKEEMKGGAALVV